MTPRQQALKQVATAPPETAAEAVSPHPAGHRPSINPTIRLAAMLVGRSDDGGQAAQPYAGIRLTDVIGALSHALDMAEGQPLGHSVRTAMIGMRIGEVVGVPEVDRSALFFALLLKDLGSSANAAQLTRAHGADDRLFKAARRLTDWTDRSFAAKAFGPVSGGRTRLRQAWHAIRSIGQGQHAEHALAATRAERGASIAAMLAMPEATCTAIRAIDEHWDGNGTPHGLRGTAIPLLARIVGLAQTAEVFERAFNLNTAAQVVRERAARWFDPELVRAFETVAADGSFAAELQHADALAALRKYEPPTRVVYADELRLDTVAEAFARVIDAKSPFTARHSQNVSFLASRTAMELDLPSREVRALRRAGLLHDIGKLGVGNSILDKPSPLTAEERVEMEGHTRSTFEILRDVPRFARFAMLAASHHERLDGSGYHLGMRGGELSLGARILAAADVCEALSAVRPYRPAMPLDQVIHELRRAVAEGRLCPVAVGALTGWFNGLPNRPVHFASGGDSTSLFGI
jgi:putative nucleotidyltransferase with HDIG domain